MGSKTWEKREIKEERVPFDAVDVSVSESGGYVHLGITTPGSSISLSLDQAESLADSLWLLVYQLRGIPKSKEG